MKLFTRYSRITLVSTIIIFLISSEAYYFTLRYVLVHQIDEDLRIEEREINSFVKEHNHIPESISVKDQLIQYSPEAAPSGRRHFSTIWIQEHEKEKEEFRQLSFDLNTGAGWFLVSVSKSMEGTDNLIRSILLITISTILAILVVSILINRFALKRIWKPFYQSLDAVRKFKVNKKEELHLQASNIDEFGFMNQTLKRITAQAQLDYLSLKTFSENASHEIQTPIAIVRSKLDLLIQDEHLREEQSQALQGAYNAIDRLTRLNQSLLLLAKIENHQFEDVSVIDLNKNLEEKLSQFQELWQSQQIQVQKNLSPCSVRMNSELSDILLNNLLSNATRHNYSGGWIRIELSSQQLSVCNSSHHSALDKDRLFQRFYKAEQGNEHNGLGLSITRQICDVSGFSIDYSFEEGAHCFYIRW
ncbi:MAG: sensor histidine kinase [Flavisolibacter sp.]